MSSSGYLVPPSEDPNQEKLWVETWKRIDRFLPDLRKDLDLDGPKEMERDKEQSTEEPASTAVRPKTGELTAATA